MAHNYCPYELVFGKISNLPKQFNSIENIEPIYILYDYARESKYRLVAHKRARIIIEENKEERYSRVPRLSDQSEMEICKAQSEIEVRHLPVISICGYVGGRQI